MIDRESLVSPKLDTAGSGAPCAGHRWQARDGAHRHPSAAVALHPAIEADGCRLARRVFNREGLDRRRWDPADGRHTIRRVLGGARCQLGPAHAVSVHVILVAQAVTEDDVHHPERQRRVSPRQQRDMLIALLRGPRPPRIDRYHPRPFLARRSDERPEVGIRGQRVGAPQEDRARSVEAFRIHTHGITRAVGHADHAGGAADRAIEEGGAERVEEPSIHRPVVQEPERAAERVRQDCLRPHSAMISLNRNAISSSAFFQEIGSKRPSPFAPTRRIGWSTRPV